MLLIEFEINLIFFFFDRVIEINHTYVIITSNFNDILFKIYYLKYSIFVLIVSSDYSI